MNLPKTINKLPILVTGSHRSGSTWVGRSIACSRDVFYVHEPFNPRFEPSIFPLDISRDDRPWYAYITSESDNGYQQRLAACLDFQQRNDWRKQLLHTRNWRDLRKAWRMASNLRHYSDMPRMLMKDPIALLSAEWVAATLNAQVIVLIRHPAAFVSSLLKQNWGFDFKNFLMQHTLMREKFAHYQYDFARLLNKDKLSIEVLATLWKVLHSVILEYQQKHPDWKFYRHEDISEQPLHCYKEMFGFLNLEWTTQIQSHILASTSAENPDESKSPKTLKLNSRANIDRWKQYLDKQQIKEIREIVESISSHFYSDNEW